MAKIFHFAKYIILYILKRNFWNEGTYFVI
jgi:hypothetical protein